MTSRPCPGGIGRPWRGPGDAAAQLDRVEATLSGVVATLTRLDEGRYHQCTRCGAPLDRARLAADPLTEHCPDRCGDVALSGLRPAALDAADRGRAGMRAGKVAGTVVVGRRRRGGGVGRRLPAGRSSSPPAATALPAPVAARGPGLVGLRRRAAPLGRHVPRRPGAADPGARHPLGGGRRPRAGSDEGRGDEARPAAVFILDALPAGGRRRRWPRCRPTPRRWRPALAGRGRRGASSVGDPSGSSADWDAGAGRGRVASARCTGPCCATAGRWRSRCSTPASTTPSGPTWPTPRCSYRLFSAFALKRLDVRGLVDELRERMADELDYRIEAAHQARVRRLLPPATRSSACPASWPSCRPSGC